MLYLNATQKAAAFFQQEGKEASRLIAAGKEKAAFDFIDSNQAKWIQWLTASWQGIVEEIGDETFQNIKSAVLNFETKAETDAFNPWEPTIQGYIKKNTAKKVVAISLHSKKKMRGIIDKHRADNATLDTIAKAINDEFTDFSRYRAYRIARTEIVGASNYASYQSAKQSGVIDRKEWISSEDSRVRKTHDAVHEEIIPLKKRFSNGLMFPADYSENLPAETIMCRCALGFLVKDFAKPKPKPKPKPAPKPAAIPEPKPKPIELPPEPKLPPAKEPEKVPVFGNPDKRAHRTRDEFWGRNVDFDQLSDDEKAEAVKDDMKVSKKAAVSYVDGLQAFTGSSYKSLRAASIGAETPTPKQAAQIAALEEFIEISPKWNASGTIYRGIGNYKEIPTFHVGAIIDMKGFSSWSSTERKAQEFARKWGTVRYIFVCEDTMTGASVKHLSLYDTEDEVFLSKGTKWLIESMVDKGDGYIYCYTKEVEHGK